MSGILLAIAKIPSNLGSDQISAVEDSFRKVSQLSKGGVVLEELLTGREDGDRNVVAIYRSEVDLDDPRNIEYIKEALHHLGSTVRFYSARKI